MSVCNVISAQTPQKNFDPRILYSFYVEFSCLGKLRELSMQKTMNNKTFKRPNELNQPNPT